MGIRVHKVVGWGVVNLQKDDPRVDFAALRKGFEDAEDISLSDFRAWCGRNQSRLANLCATDHIFPTVFKHPVDEILYMMEDMPDISHYDVGRAVVWGDEFLDANVLMTVPLECTHKWIRHDDLIDWLEERSRGATNTVKQIDTGIHPYDSHYVRYVKPDSDLNILGFNGDCKVMEAATYRAQIRALDAGLKDAQRVLYRQHLRDDWRPRIPLSIIATLAWYDCFTDLAEFIDGLRPMLYTYWS